MAVQRPYKVRKSWEDTQTQKGNFAFEESAVKRADEFKSEGYKVFYQGREIYDPNVLAPVEEICEDSHCCEGVCTGKCRDDSCKCKNPRDSFLKKIVKKLFRRK